MPPLLLKIPQSVTIACSGGIDSMFAAAFCLAGKKNVTLAYFNHGTQYAPLAQEFVAAWAEKNKCVFRLGAIKEKKKSGQSWEEYWRIERYSWLQTLDGKVITAHHLNDVIETWIFSSLRGNPKLIPPTREPNILRPFLLWSKKELEAFASKRSVPWIEDPSNGEVKYCRNRIRHKIMPEALLVNPGLETTIKNLVRKNNG